MKAIDKSQVILKLRAAVAAQHALYDAVQALSHELRPDGFDMAAMSELLEDVSIMASGTDDPETDIADESAEALIADWSLT